MVQALYEKAFLQASHEDDAAFFEKQSLDSLMDMGARTAVSALYRTSLPVGGRTLDLLCGAFSHLPKEAVFQEFIGVDIHKKALEANKSLTNFIVHNINITPALPFESESFDGVTLCDGFAYLQKPQDVLNEVYRLLKPSMPCIICFSERFIPQKAVALWQALESADRVRFISGVMQRAGFSEIDTGEVIPPEDLNAWKDSVYAVIGRKSAISS